MKQYLRVLLASSIVLLVMALVMAVSTSYMARKLTTAQGAASNSMKTFDDVHEAKDIAWTRNVARRALDLGQENILVAIASVNVGRWFTAFAALIAVVNLATLGFMRKHNKQTRDAEQNKD